jgi:DNA repair protein RadB
MADQERVSTGSADFDRLLHGGFETGTITQIYGEPAGAKSTLCLIAVVACLKAGKSAIFIDTEGFSIERFRQIAGPDADRLAENLYIYEPSDFDQQGVMIAGSESLLRTKSIGLIILDSATAYYRTNLEKGRDAMQALTRQMMHLLGLAKRYRVPVIVTNQVYIDTLKHTYTPLGGTSLEHISKVIVKVSRTGGSSRRAILVKHRSLQAGGFFDFDLTGEGIRSKMSPD